MGINMSAGMGTSANQTNYPNQRNGMWMSIAAIIGSIVGRAFNSGTLDKAKDAESSWRAMTDAIRDKGLMILNSGDKIEPMTDDIATILYNFAKTGYCPDYLYILNNAVQASSIQFDGQIEAMKRQASRFNTGLNADTELTVRMQKAAAVVLGFSQAAESARQFMWSANFDMLDKASGELEKVKNDRYRLGGDMVSGVGESYALMSQSYRQTAAMDADGTEMIFTALGTLVPMFLSSTLGDDLLEGFL